MANQYVWTRNYWKLYPLNFGFTGEGTNETNNPTDDNIWFRTTDGVYRTALNRFGTGYLTFTDISQYNHPALQYSAYTETYKNDTRTDLGSPALILGNGTGTLSEDSYEIFSKIGENITVGTKSVTHEKDVETHKYTRVIKFPITYSGANPVTITEMGFYGMIPYITRRESSTAPVYTYLKPILLYHELFETPMELLQNDSMEITFRQSIIEPNYSPYPNP